MGILNIFKQQIIPYATDFRISKVYEMVEFWHYPSGYRIVISPRGTHIRDRYEISTLSAPADTPMPTVPRHLRKCLDFCMRYYKLLLRGEVILDVICKHKVILACNALNLLQINKDMQSIRIYGLLGIRIKVCPRTGTINVAVTGYKQYIENDNILIINDDIAPINTYLDELYESIPNKVAKLNADAVEAGRVYTLLQEIIND